MNGRNLSRGGASSAMRDTALGRMWVPPGAPPCSEDPELFSDPPPKPRGQTREVRQQHAELIKSATDDCYSSCLFRVECLEAALTDEGGRKAAFRHGIRGGLTPAERESIARRRRKAASA